jgi:hypothetical protein
VNKKIFHAPIVLKASQTGQFTAEFATLNVIDHDGDWTKNGAFIEGQETLIEPWNHNYGNLPVGKGVIHEVDDKAVIEGQFFMDTQSGLEHYRVVKNLGPLQEWSYSFEILESSPGHVDGQNVRYLEKLDVWGVAPVTRGAGIATGTTSIKGASYRNWRPISKTISDIRLQIYRLMPPGAGELRKLLDNTLADVYSKELDDLEDRLAENSPTVVAEWTRVLLSEGHNQAWVDAVIAGEVQALEARIMAQNPSLECQPGAAHRMALQMITRPFRPGIDGFPRVGADLHSPL